MEKQKSCCFSPAKNVLTTKKTERRKQVDREVATGKKKKGNVEVHQHRHRTIAQISRCWVFFFLRFTFACSSFDFLDQCLVISLLPERRTFAELCLAACGACNDGAAAVAAHLGRGVAVDSGDVEARRALDVHEVRVRALHEARTLVLAALSADSRVREIGVEESHPLVSALGEKACEEKDKCKCRSVE